MNKNDFLNKDSIDYFTKELNRLIETLPRRTYAELKRYLEILSEVANEEE